MARKRRGGDEGGGDTWLNTYADMVTLLLTFFVMLFSMSSVEEEKWEMLLEAFVNRGNETSQIVLVPEGDGQQMGANSGDKGSPSGDNIDTENNLPIDFDELYEYLKAYVEQNGMQGSVEIEKGAESVFIRFKDSIFFNPDSSYLKVDSNGILDFLGDCLKNVEDQIMVININGHTATVAEKNYHISDRMLSSERASRVAIYFEDEKEIDPKKILAIGYGKNYPVDTNDSPEGRQNNRRVEMMIVSNESNFSANELIDQFLNGTYDKSKYPEHGGSKDILFPDKGK